MISKKKNRLILSTGIWSTILSVGYLLSRNDCDEFQDTIYYTWIGSDLDYIEKIKSYSNELWNFKELIDITEYIYINEQTDKNFPMGSNMKEYNELLYSINTLLDGKIFDEIIIPGHFVSKHYAIIANQMPYAKILLIEEGLSHYINPGLPNTLVKYQKICMNLAEEYIYFKFNMPIEPICDYSQYKIQYINPDEKSICETLKKFTKFSLKSNLDTSANNILFNGTGEYFTHIMKLEETTLAAITHLLNCGFIVYYKPHPRHEGNFVPYLCHLFYGHNFYILDGFTPTELLAIHEKWDAIISSVSTSMQTMPVLHKIPSFSISESNPEAFRDELSRSTPVRLLNFASICFLSLGILLKKVRESALSNENKRKAIFDIYNIYMPKYELFYTSYTQKANYEEIVNHLLSFDTIKLQELVKKNPYSHNKLIALANKEKECMLYGSSIRHALRALMCNPLRKTSYKLCIQSAVAYICPIFFWKNPQVKDEYLTTRFNEYPYELQTLITRAATLEQEHEYEKAKIFRILTITMHPWYIWGLPLFFKNRMQKYLISMTTKNKKLWLLQIFIHTLFIKEHFLTKLLKKTSDHNSILSFACTHQELPNPIKGQRYFFGKNFYTLNINYLEKETPQYLVWFQKLLFEMRFAVDTIKNNHHSHFFAHNLGVAYVLALTHKNYSLFIQQEESYASTELRHETDLPTWYISIIKKMERAALTQAVKVHFTTQYALDSYLGDPNRACDADDFSLGIFLPHPVTPASFDFSMKSSSPSNIAVPDGLTFASVGELTGDNGYEAVLDFFEAALPHVSQNIRWVCVGDGEQWNSIKVRAHSLKKMYPHFSFYPLLDTSSLDIEAVLEQCDIYIMLRNSNSLDWVIPIAMKSDCALYLNDTPQNQEFNKDNNIVFLYDYFNKDNHLFDKEYIDNYKVLNKKIYLSLFSPVAACSNYLSVFDSLSSTH